MHMRGGVCRQQVGPCLDNKHLAAEEARHLHAIQVRHHLRDAYHTHTFQLSAVQLAMRPTVGMLKAAGLRGGGGFFCYGQWRRGYGGEHTCASRGRRHHHHQSRGNQHQAETGSNGRLMHQLKRPHARSAERHLGSMIANP